MKKASIIILAFMLAFVLLFSVSCDSGNTDSPNTDNSNTDNPNTDDPNKDNNDPPAPKKYSVTWKDEYGTDLETVKYDEGTVPTAYNYVKQDTAEWDYTVDGWSATQDGEALSVLPKLTADTTYYAKVSKTKRSYTVTFETSGGSKVDAVTAEYGSAVSAPLTNPKYDGHRFIAWVTAAGGETEVEWPITVTGNVTVYAKWNEQIDIAGYLTELLDGFAFNPYYYIPETMLPSYTPNLVSPEDITDDYSSFVNLSNATLGGFGEQWNMVLNNIEQSSTFFNALEVVTALSTSSVAAFNNYLDANPGDTAHHNFNEGIYSVTIDFDGDIIAYVLDYTGSFPIFGEQTAQIALAMDIETKEKTVRVQLGDANAITYSVSADSYMFAIKYLGIRTAYFSIIRDENAIAGSIYEHITVEGIGTISSAANLCITDDYVIAVGNKADGILGFDNYICEVYDITNGELIGYEVREEKSLVKFDTLWFDLDQLNGFTSIKYSEADEAFYVNGSASKWTPMNVGKLNPSRRFDIEFRTRYVYSYDPATEKYTEHKIQVPMLFVQEGNLDTLTDDIKTQNNVTVSLAVSATDLNMLKAFYSSLIPIFIESKDFITADVINMAIGDKITFE